MFQIQSYRNTNNDHIAFNIGIILQILRNDKTPLPIRQHIDGPKNIRLKLRASCLVNGIPLNFVPAPPFSSLNIKMHLSNPRVIKIFKNAAFLTNIAESGRQNDASFAIDGVIVFAVKHIFSLGLCTTKEKFGLSLRRQRPILTTSILLVSTKVNNKIQ